jgi:hypothetical protein
MRIYELNTAVLLGGRRLEDVDWGFVPDVDAVWLMGVWKRSPAGLAIARTEPELIDGMRAALPDLRDEDVIGSPYCVRDYVVDPRFGDLAAAREALAARGLKLILDFVPNHVAPDHPWVDERPECFVHDASGAVALGRDPYFPPWPDVVQLNAFAPELRAAAGETLRAIAEQCDGVRCDMAMLMTNEVFSRTWSLAPPATEYWPEVMAGIRDDFTWIAEAYWDMEFALTQQGFDLCYDKRLYDRLAHEDAAAVRGHLQADLDYQHRLVRFIENHDEPRAATAFGPRARAAAVVMSTVPGARLYHDGQFDGRRTKIPVFLARGPVEPVDEDLRAFYAPLVALEIDDWRLEDVGGWPDNQSCRNLLAWSFAGHLAIVNFGDAPAQGLVEVPARPCTDLLTGTRFEATAERLYVALDGWHSHLLRWEV